MFKTAKYNYEKREEGYCWIEIFKDENYRTLKVKQQKVMERWREMSTN